MAYSNEVLKFNSIAEAAVTKNTFVMVGTEDNQCLISTAGASIIGVSEDPAAINTAIGISHVGQVKLELGDTVTIGQKLKSDSTGRGVAVASDKDEYGAIALEGGVVSDVISVIISKGIYNV